jgi:hypothetical protein
MDFLQKSVIILFSLTIILSIISLSMFYVEHPYKTQIHCPFKVSGNGYSDLPNISHNISLFESECTIVGQREPSTLMMNIINSTVIVGIIFVVTSCILYYNRRKYVEE